MSASGIPHAQAQPPESPASVAERLLDEVAEHLPGSRLGLLAGSGDAPAVVLALVGAEQAPWPDPRTDDSPLGRVWRGATATTGTWTTPGGSRAMVVVPLEGEEGRCAALVADRDPAAPFDVGDLAFVAGATQRLTPALAHALEVAALAEREAHDERVRLAQELHDGLAQELVALGYRIDFTRRQVDRSDPTLASPLHEARDELSRILADLRLKMADLQATVDPDGGLAPTLRSRLEQFAEITGLEVQVQVDDDGLALAPAVQDQLFRFVLDLLADARHARGATRLELALKVGAPQVRLRFTHDGESSLPSRDFSGHPLVQLGAVVFIGDAPRPGVELTLEMSPADSGTTDRRRSERIPLRS
ncbi:MAG TPA: histidine kinase [Oryzihumus sp.]|nr:histidine kinase [Oryzihumus sp.]